MTLFCLNPLDLYVKQCAPRSAIRLRESDYWKHRKIGHLRIAFPDGKYGLSEKKTSDYIVPDDLPGLRILIPERAQWNVGVF